MLHNSYLLAKIGADTAENERKFAENLPKIGNYRALLRAEGQPALAAARDRQAAGGGCARGLGG